MRERLAIRDADKKRADQAGALCDSHRVEVGKIEPCLQERFANDGNDLAQMFARGEFGHDAAIFAVNVNLRGDHAGQDFAAVRDNRGGSFIARRLDAQDANAHSFMLAHGPERPRGWGQNTELAESN